MKKTVKRILIIDDDNSHLLTAKGILESEGYTVNTHNQAFGSSVIARQLEPDLILLDINMPGLSGDRLAQIIGRNYHSSNMPILFYSSNDEDTLRKAVGQYSIYGVKDYICKGDSYDLRKKVAHYLSEN
jgi:CheY-like chemotaxis protein